MLADLLEVERLKVLAVTGRVKTRDSLEEKLNRPGKHYEGLGQLTDIVGLRVITYFEDDVDTVARIVERELEPVPEHCSDKRSFKEPDRFGYRSLHYVCRLGANRRDLREHRSYNTEMFEVQIRSILQHAWAEIEHDLGYKTNVSVPHEIKHQLSRVAGLLEIADREFKETRDKTIIYMADVAKDIQANSLTGIELNSLSYLEFIVTSPAVIGLDELLRNELDYEFSQDADEDYVVESLRWVGILSIGQLQLELERFSPLLGALQSVVFADDRIRAQGPVSPAISMFYLAQVLALAEGGVDRLEGFYKDLRVTSGDKNPRESAQETAALVGRLRAELSSDGSDVQN